MRLLQRYVVFLISLLAIASAAAPNWAETANALSGLRYRAVLIAGDWHTAAFDHATAAMQERLLAHQVPQSDLQRLSASRALIGHDGVQSSSLSHILADIEHMHPAPGEGCLVFATSHGGYDAGLALFASQNYLTPEALDHALDIGCGNAPTVAIISGCFSGNFAKPPMARANRIVLTAAREDRTSFGCDARSEYTFYDRCLLQAMDHSAAWQVAYTMITACVATREKALQFKPSEPQAWFGDAVAGMPVPGLR